jgi:hypothetical protein
MIMRMVNRGDADRGRRLEARPGGGIGLVVLLMLLVGAGGCRKAGTGPDAAGTGADDSGPVSSVGKHITGAQIIDQDEVLRGQTAMAVDVEVTGVRDISESTYQSDVVDQLRAAGIKVLPETTPPTFPLLVLRADGDISRGIGTPYIAYMLRIEYRELYPARGTGGEPRYVMGTMWASAYYGMMPALQTLSMRGHAKDLVSGFVESWKKVNPKN